MSPRLIIFDIDGTLVDSIDGIVAIMTRAFTEHGFDAPAPEAVRAIIGRSLDLAIAELLGPAAVAQASLVADRYRAHFFAQTAKEPPKLFPGALTTVRALSARTDTLLGIATGKSRRGLRVLLASAGLDDAFQTIQTADDAQSKPHPEMILNAMTEAGIDRDATVMVGDSTLDMAMAGAAGVAAIGVSWGSHARDELLGAGAARVVDGFDDLVTTIDATLMLKASLSNA